MDPVVDYYSRFDEWGRLDREPVEYRINSRFIQRYLPPCGHILDNGAGPGKYAMDLAAKGYRVALADLTPTCVETAKSKACDMQLYDKFSGFHVADARNLHPFGDEEFHASLMLGPMYHLQKEEDRVRAVRELYRVTKKGGYVFVAFMSRIRHLITSLLHPQDWQPHNDVDRIEAFMETGIFNHRNQGRFTGAYFFPVADINPFMEANGFESIKLIASGSIVSSMQEEQWEYWRQQGEDAYRRMFDMVCDAAEDPSILGASPHLLYIGKRL